MFDAGDRMLVVLLAADAVFVVAVVTHSTRIMRSRCCHGASASTLMLSPRLLLVILQQHPCEFQIPHLDSRNLSTTEFREMYESQSRPVIVEVSHLRVHQTEDVFQNY